MSLSADTGKRQRPVDTFPRMEQMRGIFVAPIRRTTRHQPANAGRSPKPSQYWPRKFYSMLNVHLRITDAATKRPTPVRVRITGADGTHFPPLGRGAEWPAGRNADVGGHLWVGRERWWYIDGACELPLPAGVPLRVQAAKGPEYTPLDETVTLGAGQIALRFALTRWADSHTDGWVSVDTRCHFISPHAALLEAQAEGVNVVNVLATPFPVLALDGNTYTTTPNLLAFSGQVPALERDGCSVVVNTFNTHPVLGKVALLNSHRPVFPLAFGGEETDDWGVCDWCDQCHRKKGVTVWAEAFEPNGGEALVAALLGKIDAIEVTGDARKVPLFPWVYRLWDAGFLLPLVGASAKDSNRVALGRMRTYVRCEEPNPPTPFPKREGGAGFAPPSLLGKGVGGLGSSPAWVEAIRAGRTFVSAGPLLALTRDGNHFCASARTRAGDSPAEVVTGAGWVAARCLASGGFAHTSPVAVGSPARKPDAVAALRKLVEQTREWADAHGRFANPKRKQALLDRCADAMTTLGGPA